VHLLHNATDVKNDTDILTDILAFANYTALSEIYHESGVQYFIVRRKLTGIDD
jgi:hypothetical protein